MAAQKRPAGMPVRRMRARIAVALALLGSLLVGGCAARLPVRFVKPGPADR